MKMDRDGSGCITIDEVEDLLHETYGFPPLEDEVNLFMKSFDLNGDGKIDEAEMFAGMLGMCMMAPMSRERLCTDQCHIECWRAREETSLNPHANR